VAADGDPWELRVHGVAGTPPEMLLEARAVDLVAGLPRGLDLHRGRQVPQHRRAFSWGALTSGQPRHAFNVLLLPYMLANVAGWMLPTLVKPDDHPNPEPSPRVRSVGLLVRLHGFVITAIFALFVALAFLRVLPSLLVALGQVLTHGRDLPANLDAVVSTRTVTVVSFLLGVVALLALGWFTKVRPRDATARLWGEDGTPVVDRLGTTWFDRDQDALWATPQTAAHLHRAHVCFAVAILTGATGWAARVAPARASLGNAEAAGPDWPQLLATTTLLSSGTVLVLAVVATAALTWRAGSSLPAGWTGLVRTGLPLLTMVAVASGVTVAPRLPTALEEPLPAVPGALTLTGATALILAAAVGVVAHRTRPADATVRQAWNGPSALLLASGVGTVFGAGLLTSLLRALGGLVDALGGLVDALDLSRADEAQRAAEQVLTSLPSSLEWVALAFTVVAVVLLLVGVVAFVRADAAIDAATPARRMVTLRAVVTPTSTLVTTIGAAGALAIAALLVAGVRRVGCAAGGVWPATQLQPLATQECLAPVTNDAILAAFVGLALSSPPSRSRSSGSPRAASSAGVSGGSCSCPRSTRWRVRSP
jgi:hypothetical protein